jgi:hypothetical protein
MSSKHIYIDWKMDKFEDKLKDRNIVGYCGDFLKSIYVQMQIYAKVIVECTIVKEYGNVCTYGPLVNIKSKNDDYIEYTCGINEVEIPYIIVSIIEVGLDFYLNNKYMTSDDMSKYAYILRGNIRSVV